MKVNEKLWSVFYEKYCRAQEEVKKELEALREELFDNKHEPYFCTTTGSRVSASDYYEFVRDILKITNKTFNIYGEEDAFKRAGMFWIYEYHIITKRFKTLERISYEYIILQHAINHICDALEGRVPFEDDQIKCFEEHYRIWCEELPEIFKYKWLKAAIIEN